MSKTIFNSGRNDKRVHVFFGSEEIEITDEYNCLGLIQSQRRSFITVKQKFADQANKVLFSLMKRK